MEEEEKEENDDEDWNALRRACEFRTCSSRAFCVIRISVTMTHATTRKHLRDIQTKE